MKNKIISSLVTLILISSLAGCGDSGESSSNGAVSNLPADTEPSSITEVKSDNAQDLLNSISIETAEAKGVCGADAIWYYQNGVLVIKGNGELTNYTSSDYDNDPLKDYRGLIGWIIVEEGITSIGDYNFYDCQNLSRVELPTTLTKIGDSTFSDCGNLQNITLPQGLETIGEWAFADNDSMKTITIPSSVKEIGAYALGDFKEIIFEGDAPQMPVSESNGNNELQIIDHHNDDVTIIYSGNGFEEYIEQCPQYNWVKR